jgi:glutathione S-transferase
VRKLDAMAERPADYFEEQPFGQVPSYHDDTVSLFESGATSLLDFPANGKVGANEN